jgi:hypothetical protein
MTARAPVQSRSLASIVAVLALGLAAIYLVPFHVPENDGLSFSYLFGFSNRTAIALLMLFILGFALWTRGLGLELPAPSSKQAGSFRAVAWTAIAASAAIALLLWLSATLLAPLAEAQYFLDRLEMFRMGGHLYRDFEFDYGPLMFYPAVWIARIGHISLGHAFYLAWVVQVALGNWVLWKVVQTAARGTGHGRAIFLLLWAFFAVSLTDSGPNYTPLRFCAALGFALWIHALYTRGASHLATFGVASAASTLLLIYSPEQGIALTLGTILFFLICVRPARPRTLLAVAAFTFFMCLVFAIALRFGLLNNVKAVGGGALNFPLLFSFPTLVLLLLEIVAGCAVIASFRTRSSGHPLLYLICISAVTVPAAFSRADVGHIVINTLGALIAALVVLSQYPALWRWTWPASAIVVLLSSYAHLATYKQPLRDQIHVAVFDTRFHSRTVTTIYTDLYLLTHRNAQARLAQLRASMSTAIDPRAPQLPPHASLFAPLGVQRRLRLPQGDPQIVTGFYPWLDPITNRAAIQEKIAELQTHPDWPLLLWSDKPAVCISDPEDARKTLRTFLLAPYIPHARHQVTADAPFCEYIFAHYALSPYASPIPASFIWIPSGIDASLPNGQHP